MTNLPDRASEIAFSGRKSGLAVHDAQGSHVRHAFPFRSPCAFPPRSVLRHIPNVRLLRPSVHPTPRDVRYPVTACCLRHAHPVRHADARQEPTRSARAGRDRPGRSVRCGPPRDAFRAPAAGDAPATARRARDAPATARRARDAPATARPVPAAPLAPAVRAAPAVLRRRGRRAAVPPVRAAPRLRRAACDGAPRRHAPRHYGGRYVACGHSACRCQADRKAVPRA